MPTLAYQVSQENGATVAQKIQTIFIDDLDGGDADGTVRFGLDGTEYEIDLNAGHAQALRETLAPYVRAARRLGVRPGAPPAAGAARAAG
jgi:Lsr2